MIRALCLCLFLLAGCGLQPVRAPVERVDVAPERFFAHGRLTLRQPERRDHLGFDWQHAPERDAVLLLSPLGQGLAEIGRDAGGAWLARPGQADLRATDLDELAAQVFGIALPLAALPAWLRGVRGNAGTLDGWHIAVTETAPHGGRVLPRRIEAHRDDIELLILIDGWGDGD